SRNQQKKAAPTGRLFCFGAMRTKIKTKKTQQSGTKTIEQPDQVPGTLLETERQFVNGKTPTQKRIHPTQRGKNSQIQNQPACSKPAGFCRSDLKHTTNHDLRFPKNNG
ncbi:hypothetical protein, partial [uncultured Roseibium sp.]|uniref:hypothetical protein n=1 Tax=uncultured Roseibium sp. TaxID=1936171 RepID=UPI00262FA6B0